MLTKIQPRNYDICIGIDTSQKSYSVTYRSHDHEGKSLTMNASPEALHRYFQKRFPKKRLLYVYETGPTGYGLYDYLTTQNQSCTMIHAASIQQAPKDYVKNNRIDSRKLAEQTLSGQLRGIRVPSSPYRELRHLANLRQQYVRDSVRIKQRIKSLLLFEGLVVSSDPKEAAGHWSARSRQALRNLAVPNETVRFRLKQLLEDLEYYHRKILAVHQALRSFYREHADIQSHVRYLRSIPGFGFVVSMYFLSRVGDPKELRDIREIAAFAGVVPSEYSTGETIRKGSITHMGDSILRSLLVEAAWAAIRKDQELRQFYNRIRARNGFAKGAKIAIVAVARKLTHRAYRVLKDQRLYLIH